jgi:RNA polymerase sigma-70 factor (ECF subfamily)
MRSSSQGALSGLIGDACIDEARSLVPTAAELMSRYCDGDAAAFRALYALAAPRVLAYLLSLVRSRDAAEEILQQSFIKLHQARAAYVRGADPIPWLYTIAHRTCIDEIRRSRRSYVSVQRSDRPLPETPAEIDGRRRGDDVTFDDATIALVLDAVETLPENQRLAVVLTKIHGKSLAEAAEILGTTPGAVKLRAHRGYVAVREILRERAGDLFNEPTEP